MKPALHLIFFFVFATICRGQASDPPLTKGLTIKNFCLCSTTITGLKQQDADLKEVSVEEMDLPGNCYGQDARFIAGVGYQTESQPGMVFQKDQISDYVSKIRLTRQYKGNLPDGNSVDLKKFLLKDLLKLYPQLKNKWGSRGCSDYWNFSNDTISFYVKVDKNKTPQFPVDEAYYATSPIEAIDLITSCHGVKSEEAHYNIVQPNNQPIYIIDNERVDTATLRSINPNTIALLTVYKGAEAAKHFGIEAKNGLINIETKSFARNKYWTFFTSQSNAYAKLAPSFEMENDIQYILNGKPLIKNYERDLSAIDTNSLQELKLYLRIS